MLKAQKLFTRLNITDPEAQKAFWEGVTISPGYTTLEWVWPSPPPFHTYEELPMLKEIDEKQPPATPAAAHH